MTRMIGYTPAPRKTRLVIFVNESGELTRSYTSHQTRDGWQLELLNLRKMGFSPLTTVNIPFRYWKRGPGFNPVYQYFWERYQEAKR